MDDQFDRLPDRSLDRSRRRLEWIHGMLGRHHPTTPCKLGIPIQRRYPRDVSSKLSSPGLLREYHMIEISSISRVDHCDISTELLVQISGVESGNQCYCSNSVTANTLGQRVADSQCNLNCTGNSAETCGAKGRIAILYNRAGAQSSSSSSTPGSVGAANAQGYHGCFAIGSMTSATNPHLTSTTVMSAGLCQRYCAFNGYPLAGTQGGSGQ